MSGLATGQWPVAWPVFCANNSKHQTNFLSPHKIGAQRLMPSSASWPKSLERCPNVLVAAMGRRKRVGDMRTGRGRSSISGIIFSRNLGKFYVLGLSESALSMASAAGLYARLRRALATTNSSHSFFWRTLSLAAAQAKNFYVFGCGWWYDREIVLLPPLCEYRERLL